MDPPSTAPGSEDTEGQSSGERSNNPPCLCPEKWVLVQAAKLYARGVAGPKLVTVPCVGGRSSLQVDTDLGNKLPLS